MSKWSGVVSHYRWGNKTMTKKTLIFWGHEFAVEERDDMGVRAVHTSTWIYRQKPTHQETLQGFVRYPALADHDRDRLPATRRVVDSIFKEAGITKLCDYLGELSALAAQHPSVRAAVEDLMDASKLPTFGGKTPGDTSDLYSWSTDHVLIRYRGGVHKARRDELSLWRSGAIR